jgi:hypothetical protein
MKVEFIAFDGPTHWAWIQERYPFLRMADTCGFMTIDRDTGDLLAAVICDTFMHNTAQLSLIVEDSVVFKHGFAEEVAQYMIEGHQKDWAFCKVSANNSKCLSIVDWMGFKEVGRLSGAGKDGCDHILFEMHKDDCKFYIPAEQVEVA